MPPDASVPPDAPQVATPAPATDAAPEAAQPSASPEVAPEIAPEIAPEVAPEIAAATEAAPSAPTSDFPSAPEIQPEAMSIGSADPTTEFPSAPGSDGEFPTGDTSSDFPAAPDPSVFPDALPEPEHHDPSAHGDQYFGENSN